MSGVTRSLFWAWAALAGAIAATSLGGCTTEAFCFVECGTSTTTTGAGTSGTGIGGFNNTGGAGGCFPECTSSSSGGCVPTNDGKEICDGLDNDCNDKIDDVDFGSPKSCGTCDNDCTKKLLNNDPASIMCDPSSDPGKTPGTCKGSCITDYYDLSTPPDGTCEYYCVKTADDDKTCDHSDDDCDGTKDEDVDLCTSTTDCGKCGNNCVVLHGSPACVHTGGGSCDASNTQCEIGSCDCTGPGNCWADIDLMANTGCEYQCDPTNGGVEICDGLDNDCDGKIDGADDLSGDPAIGVVCFGGVSGICAAPANSGVTACVAGQPSCEGANVVKPGDQLEICNTKDDNCNGLTDDNPTDIGGSCGVSNNFPCTLGTNQCVNGALICIGAVNPGVEICNGQDDDCDGVIDMTGNMAPSDSVGTCNVPVPPPPGVPSPCSAGTKACQGGSIVCNGSQGPTAPADACGIDSNCDGLLNNQPNFLTDVHHCGGCNTDCTVGAVHANWGCSGGMCQFQGCQTGFYDNGGPGDLVAGDNKCGYACLFFSQQETCNGNDDNCNGQVDEGVIAPAPSQVCGVSPNAMAPECSIANITVTCQAGGWKCNFMNAAVCNPTCGQTAEICDGLDNNCNGNTDENVSNIGQPCASDVGLPPPGDGACRTFGTFVCNGNTMTKCSAVKASCATLPGGCTELCDGVDNDCDGSVDEAFNAKGSNPTFFVKPVATKIAAATWIHSFEASRPSATNIAAGSGNGYYTSAPAGSTLDKTPACSVQGKIPWFDVTGPEVEQTCTAMGGHICTTTEWQGGCNTTTSCSWGYAPRGAACTSGFQVPPPNPGKFCNLAGSFDFDAATAGDQDGLLVAGSPSLSQCFADWSGLLGNPAASDKLFDITGNLREITKLAANQYVLMGGAFDTQSEAGAACGFTFYNVTSTFQFFDTGFRCCFSADPTL